MSQSQTYDFRNMQVSNITNTGTFFNLASNGASNKNSSKDISQDQLTLQIPKKKKNEPDSKHAADGSGYVKAHSYINNNHVSGNFF